MKKFQDILSYTSQPGPPRSGSWSHSMKGQFECKIAYRIVPSVKAELMGLAPTDPPLKRSLTFTNYFNRVLFIREPYVI
jgi:hypothetical protein